MRDRSQEPTLNSNEQIVVVGAGKMGKTILRSFPSSIAGIVTTQSVISLVKDGFSSLRRYSAIKEVSPEELTLLWLAVPDDQIEIVVEKAAELRGEWSGTLVIHSSGATSIEALSGLQALGAEVAAVHPNLMLTGAAPFPQSAVWGVTSSSNAYTRILQLLQGFNPVLIEVDDQKRSLYHAGATVAANYSMTLFSLGIELYKRAGIPDDLAVRIVHEFIVSSVERVATVGIKKGLTGPVQRGDEKTLREHIEAIGAELPNERQFFEELIKATIRALDKEHHLRINPEI